MTGAASGSSAQRKRSARPHLAILVAAVVLAASAGVVLVHLEEARNVSGPSSGAAEIAVLPSPGTRSACIEGVPDIPRPVLSLDTGVFQANTYSVPSGTTGHVGMCYESGSGSLLAYVNWTHVGAAGGWFSYPQVTYGVNSWDGAASTYTNQSAAWTLPQTVSQVVDDDEWTTVSYTFHPPPSTDTDGYDLSLDDFFTESLPPVWEHGPFVEVMVWFAHHITYPTKYVRFSTPTLVNSTVESEPWDVAYWCHGTDNGTNANVSFDYAYDGPTSDGVNEGTIGVNVSALLANVAALMPAVTCWTGPTDGFSQFHLDEANLGSEDGAIGNSSYNYSWTVSGYCFHTQVGEPTEARLDCPADPGPAILAPRGPIAPGITNPYSSPPPAPSLPRGKEPGAVEARRGSSESHPGGSLTSGAPSPGGERSRRSPSDVV